MKFSVCIPAYRPYTLPTPVQSVIDQMHIDWELLIVGQGDLSGARASEVKAVAERFAAKDHRIQYIHLEHQGHSRALNAGLKHARFDTIVYLDDDCEAAPDWLSAYERMFVNWPEVGLIGGAVHRPPKLKRFGVCPALLPVEAVYDPEMEVDRPPPGLDWISCNVAIRRFAFNKVGQFDEALGPGTVFPAGGETDYKLRMEAQKIKMGSTPSARITHTHGYRYGIQAIIQHSRNYASGNGALAAKMTLMGDPRGAQMLSLTRQERLTKWLHPFRPHRLPFDLMRWRDYVSAYHACLNEYQVENDLLVSIHSSQLFFCQSISNT